MCHISGFICSGFIRSDRTFRLVYSDSNLIVTQFTFSYICIIHYIGLFILCKYVSHTTLK